MRIKGLTRMFRGLPASTRTTPDAPIRQSTDPFPQSDRFSAFFAQWVCSLASTPPHIAASPPPNGGNGVIRTTTRRRHADRQPLMLQNPHHHRRGGHRTDHKARLRCRHARQNSPNAAPLPYSTRDKIRPARNKTPISGHFSYAGRTLSRSRPPSGRAGRTFSHTGHSHVATVKPPSPLRPLMQTNVKPPSPLLSPQQQPLKPTTPLQPKNTLKTPISHPQRR